MRRRVASTALFCLLASLTIAGTAPSTSAQAPTEQSCITSIDGGEICVRVDAQCAQGASDITRSGVVVVWITNDSQQTVDASVMIGSLVGQRQQSVGRGETNSVRVTGRADGNYTVNAELTGPSVVGGSVELAPLSTTTWCDSTSLALRSCTIAYSTAELTLVNAGDIDVPLTHRFRSSAGGYTTEPIGTARAGASNTFSIAVPSQHLPDFAIEAGSVRILDNRDCTFDPPSCDNFLETPANECEAMFNVLELFGWERTRIRTGPCAGPFVCVDGRATHIWLDQPCQTGCNDNRLTPSIAASIGELRSIQNVRISNENFVDGGQLPAELGQLSNLTRLVLNLDLEGEIPSSFGNFTALQELVLTGNKLSGPIPESLSSLTQLQSLDLSYNEFSGSIPEWLGTFPALRRIVLDWNNFDENVPASLFRTPLWELGLAGNQLDALPADAGPVADAEPLDRFPPRQEIRLNNNTLSGPVPAWISSLNIESLDMSGNDFTGPVPATFGSWNIGHIDLSDNALSGPVPATTASLSLDLSDNRFTGTVPPNIASHGLRHLSLAGNDLTGPIPPSLTEFDPLSLAGSQLVSLDLADNRITGTIRRLFTPDSLLHSLDVTNNQISGQLPEIVGQLSVLRAGGNRLLGTIPTWTRPMSDLDLSDNDLTGQIPTLVFARTSSNRATIRLGGNQLSGPLPDNIASASHIDDLNLLPNGCLTATPAVGANLASLGIDPDRLCDDPGLVLLCRDEVVTVDMALGQVPTDGDDVILGTLGDDEIPAGDGDDLVCGGGGDDTIWGQGGNDEIHGDDGHDRIRGGAGDDLLFGHDGRDDINGGTGNDEVWGQDDSDTLRGGSGDDLVHGGNGNDSLVAGNGGVDRVFGGDGNDAVNGGPRGDTISGGAGDDYINGNGGADTITGNSGNDFIRGGPQSDTIDGGDGNDECNGGTNNAVVPDHTIRCETEINIP